MSKFFVDSVHENMDELTQLVRPIIWSVNNAYTELPDEFELSRDLIDLIINSEKNEIIKSWFKEVLSTNLDNRACAQIRNKFVFRLEGSPKIDLENKEIIDGKIFIVKTQCTLTEEQMLLIAGHIARDIITQSIVGTWSYNVNNLEKKQRVKRGLEVASYMGNKQRTTSGMTVAGILSSSIERNDWNIRDMDLILKLSGWIREYIETGCLQSMANITKMKCMTHGGNPIYSMEEIV